MTTAADLLPDRNANSLSADAECAAPDALDSAGAKFLESVFDGVREALDYRLGDGQSVAEAIQDMEDSGATHEIADGAPCVYTHTRWMEFVDLCAYNEDVTELGDDGSDLTRSAGVALYIIADRLVRALLDEAQKTADASEDDDAEEDDA